MDFKIGKLTLDSKSQYYIFWPTLNAYWIEDGRWTQKLTWAETTRMKYFDNYEEAEQELNNWKNSLTPIQLAHWVAECLLKEE